MMDTRHDENKRKMGEAMQKMICNTAIECEAAGSGKKRTLESR